MAPLNQIAGDSLQDRVRLVPELPGVYLFRDPDGAVVYVGKARRLRERLLTHLAEGRLRPDFEFIITAGEVEALWMEADLIKHYRPRLNVKLRDDKDYLLIRVPTEGEFPALEVVRRRGVEEGRCFGPFIGWSEVKRVLAVVEPHLPARTCPAWYLRHHRPCPNFRIGRCAGPCAGVIGPAAYRRRLDEIAGFLGGRTEAVAAEIAAQMREAAANRDFEIAARLRDELEVVAAITRPRALLPRERGPLDAIGFARYAGRACALIVRVQGGRFAGERSCVVEAQPELPDGEVLRSLLIDRYGQAAVPARIDLSQAPAEPALLEAWLSERRGRAVRIAVPRRGGRRLLCAQLALSAGARLALAGGREE